MFVRTVALVCSGAAALSACDQLAGKHEIVRAGNQTFLLDKASGAAKLIEGTSLLTIKAPDPTAASEPYKRAKTWSEQSINDLAGVQFKLRTKYRDGSMLWMVEAAPFAGELEAAYLPSQVAPLLQPTVLFELYDEEGFKIGEPIEVKIRLGSRTVDAKNQVIELSWSGVKAMSSDTYRSAALLSTRWYGFKKD